MFNACLEPILIMLDKLSSFNKKGLKRPKCVVDWYGWWDSDPHERSHQFLILARLPIPPQPRNKIID